MLKSLMAIALLAGSAVAQSPAATPLAQVEAALTASAAGWNAGDLDRFMAAYADDATFVGARNVRQGKSAIADSYRGSFEAGINQRGRLSFRTLASRPLSAVHMLYVGRWTLTKPDGTAESGHTSLVFERRRAGWQIIADHSS